MNESKKKGIQKSPHSVNDFEQKILFIKRKIKRMNGMEKNTHTHTNTPRAKHSELKRNRVVRIHKSQARKGTQRSTVKFCHVKKRIQKKMVLVC